MGREVWIYELEEKESKSGLHLLLSDKFRFKVPFESFLANRKNEIGENYQFEYNTILKIISDTITQITPSLLFEITYWLSEVIGLSQDEQNSLLSNEACISLIYESSTKSEANGLMIMYYNYLEQKTKSYARITDSGIMTSSKELIYFIDHLIFLLNKIQIFVSKEMSINYSKKAKDNIDEIIIYRSNDDTFMKVLNSELANFKSLYKLDYKDNQTKKHPEFELVVRNTEMLMKFLKIRKRIINKNVNIILIDSK